MPYVVQRALGLAALVLLSPFIAALAVAVRATSGRPAFFRATRVAPAGTFTAYKLRTMERAPVGSGPAITAAGDARVTRLGGILRQTKLDELPQLLNVARGEMALVGPRPEDPRYVDRNDPLHRFVFAARPGITGPTALAYRDEEALLASAAQELALSEGRAAWAPGDLERAYRERILPAKMGMDATYLRSRSFAGDVAILVQTFTHVLRRVPGPMLRASPPSPHPTRTTSRYDPRPGAADR
jgi:lipopolysaccharide/colanic/teichoic acid biosynthesis glycosyltransferase